MSTTWQMVFDRAKRRYGLTTDAEDGLLVNPLFLDRVNELFAEMSEGTQAWRQTVMLNLPTTNPIALPANVYQVIDGSVSLDLDGSGQFLSELELLDEAEARLVYGPIESLLPDYPPRRYSIARGSSSGGMFNLWMIPPSTTALTNGLRLSAAVYAPAITSPSDTIALQQGEERFLVPGLCLALAETELSRGRQDAPVALWDRRWKEAVEQFSIAARENVQGSRPRVHYEPDVYDW